MHPHSLRHFPRFSLLKSFYQHTCTQTVCKIKLLNNERAASSLCSWVCFHKCLHSIIMISLISDIVSLPQIISDRMISLYSTNEFSRFIRLAWDYFPVFVSYWLACYLIYFDKLIWYQPAQVPRQESHSSHFIINVYYAYTHVKLVYKYNYFRI